MNIIEADKTYLVKTTGAEEWSYLVKTWSMGDAFSAGADIYQRGRWWGEHKDDDFPPRGHFDAHSEVGLGKDWDGTMRMGVETDGSSPSPESVGWMLGICEFFADQMMAAEGCGEYGRFDTFEESLEFLGLGSGGAKNPGIEWSEYVEPVEYDTVSRLVIVNADIFNDDLQAVITKDAFPDYNAGLGDTIEVHVEGNAMIGTDMFSLTEKNLVALKWEGKREKK